MAGEAGRTLALFEAGTVEAGAFAHRDHLRMGFEMLRRYTFAEAVHRYARALQKIVAAAGQPQRYHETITVAFLALIAERVTRAEYTDFAAFERANPALLDQAVLGGWYSSGRLRSELARRTFLLPDRCGPQVMSAARLLDAYRWLFAGCIGWSSGQTLIAALAAQPGAGLASLHHVLLGAMEILGAGMLLHPATRIAGAIALLVAFALAGALSARMGEASPRFLFYAGTVAFIVLMERRLPSS
jgi:hypothetical protein